MAKKTAGKKWTKKSSSKKSSKKSSNLALYKAPTSTLELKEFVQGAFAYTNIGLNGTVIYLNNIPQATDIGARIGRHINMVSIDVAVTLFTSSTGNSDYVYTALVYDRQPDQFSVNFTDIIDNSVGPIYNSFKNTGKYRDRFAILAEKRSHVGGGSASAPPSSLGEAGEGYWRWHKSLKGLPCEFSTSSTSTPHTGALYLILSSWANSSIVTQNAGYTYNSKITFTDP
jgi:hypothetical protein